VLGDQQRDAGSPISRPKRCLKRETGSPARVARTRRWRSVPGWRA